MSLKIQNINKIDTVKLKYLSMLPFFGASSDITFQFPNDAGIGNITGFFAKCLDSKFDTIDSITLNAVNINYSIINNMYICNAITTSLSVGFYKLYLTDGVNQYESEEFYIKDLTQMIDN
jgi:hypothetical protein